MVTLHIVFFCLGVIPRWIGHASEKIRQHLEEELPGKTVVYGYTGVPVGPGTRLY